MSRLAIPWVAAVAGLAAGLLVGLVYTWVIDPLQPVNVDPSYMQAPYRQDWLRLLALSYVNDPDLQRAQARLDGLEEAEVAMEITNLIEGYSAAGRPADEMRQLVALADAMDIYTPAMLVYLQEATLTSRPTPSPTSGAPTSAGDTTTPRPATPTATQVPSTPTPTPHPPPRYQLASQEEICTSPESARVEVIVTDGLGQGVSGVVVWLVWPGGAQRAVTGLKPDRGAGYADFGAEAGETYSLGVGELGVALVDGLNIEPCSSEPGDELVSSWRILLEPRESGE